MTTEPGALLPLAHGCCHLVLIGDHKQLGPHALGGNCVSLFQRLTDPSSQGLLPAALTMLNQQHRMHPKLCNFPSTTFYCGQLTTAPGIEEARPIPPGFFRGGVSPVRFVQVENGKEQRLRSGSWFNEAEVLQVIEVVKKLLSEGINASEITVLTLYRAQQSRIQVQLKDCWAIRESPPPEICSVDSFQGRENEIIVVSSVRCGSSLGFCDDDPRVNVLLTRAKQGLVILGDRATLSRSPLWTKWLQHEASSM
jgi:regulator of nonsense transcripts 1